MKQINFTILLAALMSMGGAKAFAYDVVVENEDGKTIYYNYINNDTELEVTYSNSSIYNSYYGNIKIPESVTILNRTRKVTSIDDKAFYECSGLTSITIPESVTTIGSSAFDRCSSLTSIAIPSSVTTIGFAAFANCPGLKKVIVKDLSAWCGISFPVSTSNPLYEAKHLYCDENTEITDLIIPDGVTSIGDHAFDGCTGLTSVAIPGSVTSIGDFAFDGCTGLTSATIGEGVTSIGDYALCHCSSLTSITIPSSVTSIGNDAFTSCSSLTSITIPSSVTSIAAYAFSSCSSLTSITIPSSVTSIGNGAFQSCSSLTSITIPSSVTNIGAYAFRVCSSLPSITIPSSVTSIGEMAFYGCTNLADIVSLIQEPFKVTNIVGEDNYRNGTLYVPEGTMEKYKTTEGWKQFVWIEEGFPTSIQHPQDASNVMEVQRYTIDGQCLRNPQRGINVVKMSDGTTKKVMVK